MRLRLEFGKKEPGKQINPNTGEAIEAFTPKFTRWGGLWSLSQNALLSLAGANISDAIAFFIRHDPKIDSSYLIRWQGKLYGIQSIAYDDGTPPDGFDVLTCSREVVKHG